MAKNTKVFVKKVTFDTATTDSSGVANTTAAAHGSGVIIPSGAIITNAFYNVRTTFTSATDAATIAIKVEGTGDLKAAIAISASGDVYDAGVRGCLPGSYAERTVAGDTAILDAASKAASYIKTTADREVTFTVASEALTAGALDLWITYVI